MEAHIMAFGIAREIVGQVSVPIEISEGLMVKDLKGILTEKYNRLGDLKSFMIAVNGGYATPETMIGQDDEIAIIPPVSGG